MIHVVLAGGRGTRFWPLSRSDRPKQLVRLWDDESMLQATARRLRTAPTHEELFVVAAPSLREAIDEHLPNLPASNFIEQPSPRGTLPAITLAAAAADARAPGTPVGIFPADHYIGDVDAFHRYLTAAEHHAVADAIVTLGIEPTRPETEYGYIQRAENPCEEHSSPPAFPVSQFVEKPDADTARHYLEHGGYLWNSGMFFARPDTLFRELERHKPAALDAATRLREAFESDGERNLAAFADIPEGSFDAEIVERAERVRVIPAEMDWSDVGQWSSVDAVFGEDEHGNTIDANDVVLSECADSVVVSRTSNGRLIAGADLDGYVIVDTDDATLIVPRDRAERVRNMVARLEQDDRTDLLEWFD